MNDNELKNYEKGLNKFLKRLTIGCIVIAIGLLLAGNIEWLTTLIESYFYFLAGAFVMLFHSANKIKQSTKADFARMILSVSFALFIFGVVHLS